MNYELVPWTISALEENWDEDTYPGYYEDSQKPVIIDQDRARESESGRRSNNFDLSTNNAITVGGGESAVTPIGTEYDHRIEANVSVVIEGAHEDEWGHLSSGQEFTYLVRATRYAILTDRVWPYRNPSGPVHFHSLFIDNETNRAKNQKDYFAYQLDVRFVGYEDIPVTEGFGTDFGENYGEADAFGTDFGDDFNY